MKTYIFLFNLILAPFCIASMQAQSTLSFIENKGQWDSRIDYFSRGGGFEAWILEDGIRFDMYSLEEVECTDDEASTRLDGQQLSKTGEAQENGTSWEKGETYRRKGYVFDLKLIGISSDHQRRATGKHEEYYNFFIGADSQKHASNVGVYDAVLLENVYQGIDLKY